MLTAKNLKQLMTAVLFVAGAISCAAQTSDLRKVIAEDETEFLFVDKCKNGASYRLKAYKIEVNGETIQMYDYQGPRGKGTIQSDVEPRQAKALLCNEDRSKWSSSGRQSYN